MKLSDFSLLKEDTDHYTIGHPKGRSMVISKSGMSHRALELISKLKREQHFEEGTPDGTETEMPPVQTAQSEAPETETEAPEETGESSDSDDSQNQKLDIEPVVTAQAEGATNPQAQSQSIAQAGAAPNANPLLAGQPQLLKDIESAKGTIQAGDTAAGKAGIAQAEAYKDLAQNSQDVIDDLNERIKGYNDKSAQFEDNIIKGHIDPNRYFHNMGTGSRIISALGVLFGGIGAGLTHSPNLAQENINRAINNDIMSQQNDLSKNMNLWKMNREAAGNDIQATLMTLSQMNSIAKTKAMQAAATAIGPEAQARTAQLVLGLNNQIAQIHRVMGLMDAGNQAQQGGHLTQTDPAQLVTSFVPPERQQKVFDEIGAAQDTRRMANTIMKNFEDAAKENTVLKTGAGFVRTPASVLALHQAMQPTFKDLEGTVRQAAMDNTFKNITPRPGDLDYTINQKREALRSYLQSKAAAPTAKGYGIDLSKYSSTAPMNAFAPGTIVSVGK